MSPAALALEGLAKRYEGFLAVDDLSLEVQEGQIFGLLGPNGAGKTTTLRMLLGLVHPSAGRMRIFGHEVTPGAAVLSRVGALVDSPGFVPHLSGRANLKLWWEAGGRPLRESRLDEALAVADLGAAIDRRYRTYSHGMKQRLGLAQALLGRPDLLLLDEPTNGLDPQQMREMREVVRRVSAGGSTVVLSSHLLGEVEQVCTHAAVMSQGRLVTTGSVQELTASSGSVYLEVDDVPRALEVLGSLSGVTRTQPDGSGLCLELAGTERKELVAALVGAGVGVETLTGRRRLEDAFIQLLEASPS